MGGVCDIVTADAREGISQKNGIIIILRRWAVFAEVWRFCRLHTTTDDGVKSQITVSTYLQ